MEKPSVWTRKIIADLQKKFKTDPAIAKEIGVTRQYIFQIRSKFGIKKIENRNAKRNERIRRLHKRGASVLKLSKQFGLEKCTIYNLL